MSPLPYPVTRILLPYDGSPGARQALEVAARLSLAGGEAVSGLTLLMVVGGSYVARHVQNVDLRVARLTQEPDWQRLRQRHLEEEVYPVLEEGRKWLRSQGVAAPIELEVAEGRVGDEIVARAHKGAFSHIIMGRRGLSPLKALLLGSVTRRVLSLAEKLTVVVAPLAEGPAPPAGLFPVLVPLDGSEASLAALRQAAGLVAACRPPAPALVLLHVVDVALLGAGESPPETWDLWKEQGERVLQQGRHLLAAAGLEEMAAELLLLGDPGDTIARTAEDQGCPLIYMGSRGLSGLAKLLLGSVTSRVVHLATRSATAVVYP
ncbi:MAG: universal stress protein [Syntrophobacterales bacterium]|nr:universal stress protein [Syntrophobacterales bacterium]